MRFLPLLGLVALSQLVSGERKAVKADAVSADAATVQTSPAVAHPAEARSAEGEDEYTTFNEQRVPKMAELGGDALDERLKNGYTLVKFYSPQCHHCIAVAPVFQTLYEFYYTSKPLATSAAGGDTTGKPSMNDFHHFYQYDFVAVNCLAFGDSCSKYDIHAYPTFIVFQDSEIVKQSTGLAKMDQLSGFVEETLETIKPGSRVKDGPKLPAPGDKFSPDYDPAIGVKQDAKQDVITIKPVAAPKVGTKYSTEKIPQKPKSTVVPNIDGISRRMTTDEFHELVVESEEPWLVKFYAPWCQHCQALAPTWTQVGKEMEGRLNVGEINCDKQSKLCKDLRVRGFPTIIYFSGGERVEYDGLRGLGDLVNYANKAIEMGRGVPDVTLAEFKEMEERDDVIFVYFYDQATTSEDFAALELMPLSLIGHARLVKTNDPLMAERYKITTWPKLIVSREGRPTYYTALSPRDTRDFRVVLRWMQSVWLPLVPELTISNSRSIMDGKIVVLGILTRERPDEFMVAKKEIKSAAMEWMDKQTQAFQLERQERRDAKQLRIEEAQDRNDERAERNAKQIRINMDHSDKKEVQFAWVDGVFWERWLRTTYGIHVKDGEKVIINDEDNKRYWDQTITGNYIIPSRTSILETIPKVVSSPPKIKAKLTISNFEKLIFDIRSGSSEHPYATLGLAVAAALCVSYWWKARVRRSRGGFFKLDEKDGLLGGNGNGKVD